VRLHSNNTVGLLNYWAAAESGSSMVLKNGRAHAKKAKVAMVKKPNVKKAFYFLRFATHFHTDTVIATLTLASKLLQCKRCRFLQDIIFPIILYSFIGHCTDSN